MSPISKDQWRKVSKALMFAFSAAFLGTIANSGGITGFNETALTLLHSATVAGVNGLLYAAYLLFQDGNS